ncbi:MAG: M48 family metallopeptidase [Candidatus Methylomirabilales bacterium]
MTRLWGALLSALLLAGCAAAPAGDGPVARPQPPAGGSVPTAAQGQVDPRHVERLRRLLPPLLAAMNTPKSTSDVKVGIMTDRSINAANAGGGRFYVTLGLLEQASDEQLLAVLAHEVAHEDLGHVAKAQALGAGINIAGALLGSLFPGTQAITPIAGTLVARAYSRSEEYAADAHAVTLLTRVRHPAPAQTIIRALEWIRQQSGPGGGGFLSTHPGTEERIQRLRRLA